MGRVAIFVLPVVVVGLILAFVVLARPLLAARAATNDPARACTRLRELRRLLMKIRSFNQGRSQLQADVSSDLDAYFPSGNAPALPETIDGLIDDIVRLEMILRRILEIRMLNVTFSTEIEAAIERYASSYPTAFRGLPN